MGIVRVGFAAVLILLVAGMPAGAATFVVDSTADEVDGAPGDGICATALGACTLRAAVIESNALAGTDTITLPAGTFRLSRMGRDEALADTGDLDLIDSVNIAGDGIDSTTIDGFGADRILDATGAIGIFLTQMTLRRGYASGSDGGAVRHVGPGPMTIADVRFERNFANAGAALHHTEGPLTISGGTFEENIAGYGGGGGIHKTGAGALSVSGSTFTFNLNSGGAGGAIAFDGPETVGISDTRFVANSGGGGGAVGVNEAAAVSIVSCVFEDSQSYGNGGSVSVSGPGAVFVADSTFTGGLAGGAGGGLFVDVTGTLEVAGSTFTANAASYAGGGLYYTSDMGALVLRDGTFDGNGVSGSGGGFYVNVPGIIALTNLIVRGNTASDGGGGGSMATQETTTSANVRFLDNATEGGNGGGLSEYSQGSTITDATFSGNRTNDGDGGGFYRVGGGEVSIERSAFVGNTAAGIDGQGGGLVLQAGEPSEMINVTISGNGANFEAGGLYNASDLKVYSATFAGNACNGEGGAVYNNYALRFANTILAAGTSGQNCAGNLPTSGNRNIDTDASCELDGPSDLANVDPQLEPIADNGGPSPTHGLAISSPAVDAGNAAVCPAVDQRGVTRPADGNGDGNVACDIGAYEYSDLCPGDPQKLVPGACGCGIPDTDDNANGVADCLVNAEVKARIARARELLDGLQGQRSPEQQAMRGDLKQVAGGLLTYVKDHPVGLVLADPSARPMKLAKALSKALKAATRAKGAKLEKARAKAEAALDRLDAAIAAQ